MDKKISLSEKRNWGFALLLSVPIVIFFAAYLLNHPGGLVPTGFIQYDNASYIAYAKQYLDADSFSLLYSNPFNDHASAPIYFQPQTVAFALLLAIGTPPGPILIVFTIICSVICFRLLISIYDLIVTNQRFRTLLIWLFSWGGGLLVIAGVITHYIQQKNMPVASDLFVLDPQHGWWGLNLGRSLFFSCEAYYHALFLGCVYSILTRRWPTAALLMLLLAFSQPFTGVELLGIVGFWICVEVIIDRKKVPAWFIIAWAVSLGLYILYYFFYLNQFPDHRSVATQYSLNWRLGWYRILPAYAIVGVLAIVAIYKEKLASVFSRPEYRLFVCWFVVAFLLSNHEWFFKPRQPIHFTRGYVWASLFLLGLPALQAWARYLKARVGIWGLTLFTSIFLLDNFSWILIHVASKAQQPGATYINREQVAIFHDLKGECTSHTLLISDDPTISYLSTVYTKAYPWLSHPFTTPFAMEKQQAYNLFFHEGQIDSSWAGRNVLFVLNKMNLSAATRATLTKINITSKSESSHFLILRCDSLYRKK